MKIRTDFVTNSSSSSFVFEIEFELKNGEKIDFCAEGACGEIGSTEYFDAEAFVRVSPKALGSASSVAQLINILTNGVLDDGERKIFEKRELSKWEQEFLDDGGKLANDATWFIEEIREKIKSMDDIRTIVVEGTEELGELCYRKTYKYNRDSGEYKGTILGCEFESEGTSGFISIPDEDSCDIVYFEDDNSSN